MTDVVLMPQARDRAVSQLWAFAAVSAALAGLTLVWMPFETRLIEGVPVTAKPLKFALSFVVYFATLALVVERLSEPVRRGLLLQTTVAVLGVCFLAEMAWMILQAARGEASHFNESTPFHLFMYQVVMGTGATLLVLGVALIGWIAGRDGAAHLSPGVRRGVVLGFVLSCVATLVVAGYMSSTGRFVGTPVTGATLPLLGWSTEVGDLRPAHFLSLHAMQVLPLLGLWLDRRGSPDARRILGRSAAVYAVLVAAVFLQALAGVPLRPL
ncbi:hypothetical protein [Histidinibacterium aquaticum]|uniref:Uncharacterized protein n=1 Tax=Histidinibacterium aquaticum TaxID=2613962 RepID=A0A5J5GIF9_9RHOB|nr:hypothetical protein [Histidinibacterium aquaticum]KAA9007991.1 hypothetical protein F3S47_10795 [Histidinibacterium aquaticum]